MSIADKLVTIAENVPKVYNAGYEKGKSEGGGVSPANYASVIQFSNDDWAESDTVELDMPYLSDMGNMFAYFEKTKIKTLIVKSQTPIISVSSFCRGTNQVNSILEKVVLDVDLSNVVNFNIMFMHEESLISIEGNPFDFSSATTIALIFNYCNNIQSFRVVPNTIKAAIDLGRNGKLDEATIQSVIDGLADLTGGTAQTLTLHADVKAKLTDEQKATITGKNWTIA